MSYADTEALERQIKYDGFGGGPLLMGGLGPPAPIKSGPVRKAIQSN